MQKATHWVLAILVIALVGGAVFWFQKGGGDEGTNNGGTPLVQGVRDTISPMIPEKIGSISSSREPVMVSTASSIIAFEDVYTIGREGSVQYLNDQRYSYEERLDQLANHFEDSPDQLRLADSLTAINTYLPEKRYDTDQFSDERYLTRRVIATKYDDFRIVNGAGLEEYVIASSDLDVIPDEGDLVFHPTGPSPRFIFAYDKKGTLAIENQELGGEGIWLYSEGRPEIVLFSIHPGHHIKQTSIQASSTDIELYSTNEYGYYQKHMGISDLAVLRGGKEHRVTLGHSDGISSVIKNAYVVYHDYKGSSESNIPWENMQNEFGRDWSFAEMFYQVYTDNALLKFESTTDWMHRLIDKPVTKTSRGMTTFSLQIPPSLASQDDYFSLIFQDTHDFRYTLPFRVLPNSTEAVRLDEQIKPTRQHRGGDSPLTYPRMVGTLSFPRGIVESELQASLDETYGREVVTVRGGGEYNWYSEVHDNKAYTTFFLEYRLPPNQSRSDTIEVNDAYGDRYTREFPLVTKAIPKYHLKASIQGSDINLLPKDGYRGSHLQVIETNMPSMQVMFTPCRIGNIPAPAARGQDVTREQRLLSCDTQSAVVTTYDFTDKSQRRQETEHTIEIPAQVSSMDAFKVTINNDIFPGRERGRYHESYFFKTNVGLYAKVDDQKIHIWGRDLITGEPVRGGSITLTDATGKSSTHTIGALGATIALTPALLASERLVAEYIPSEVDDSSKSYLVISPSRSAYIYGNDTMFGSVHSRVDPMQLYQSPPRFRDGGSALEKLYGYTDRGLYRPGDTVNFGGFARDMSRLGRDTTKTADFSLMTTIKHITAEEPLQTVESLTLDEFGGFQGLFTLPSEAPLGTYIVDYVIAAGPRFASYQHTIQVKEFTKPTYEIRGALEVDDPISVEVDPWYYFGAPVDRYDATVAATLIPQERCRDCRRYAYVEDEGYSNFQFGGGQSLRVDRSLTDLQEAVSLPLFERSQMPDPTATYNLVADVVVIDKRTGERLTKQLTDIIQALVEITLPGQPIERQYEGDKLPTLSIDIEDEKGLLDHTTASWYFKPYGYATQKGVDGATYTIHGHEMTFVASGTVRNEITYPKFDSPGTYLLRVQAYDRTNNLLATNEKRIEYYGDFGFSTYFGEIQNNAIRHVEGPTKTVQVGDNILLDVNPYVIGTTAIITVERGNRILDVIERKLDGSVLMIPAKETYYPNVHIGLQSVVGEEKPLVAERKEPRLLHGYVEVSVNRDDTQMEIELTSDAIRYEPREKATITIMTKDYQGKPLDARVSVAIVDKSLVDLYHIIKEPLPYFFNKMGTSVGTFTNLRFLYQMLRVYVTPGDKGGGGSDVAGRFGENRDKFLDIAYRKADVYTKDGSTQLEVDLPDNLTTRMIDAIGISKGTHLGTATHTFLVDKKVKVSSYLPQYITIGDEITFPLTAQGREGDVHNDLIASGTLSFEGRTHTILFAPSRHQPDQRYGAISLPAGMQTGDLITLDLSLVDKRTGEAYDQLRQQLPVRTKGFVERTTMLGFDQAGEITSLIKSEPIGGNAQIHISTFPIESRRRATHYLLNYPYGCAEQRVSQIVPLLLLPELEKIGAVDEHVYSDGMVYIEQGTMKKWEDVDTVVRDGLIGLLPYQATNGGFSYWTQEPKKSDYGLSLAVYGGLLQARKYGYIENNPLLAQSLKKLETYLTSTAPDREQDHIDTAYLMMARYAASAGRTVGADQQAVVEEIRTNLISAGMVATAEHFHAILAFGVLAFQGESDRARQLAEKIERNHLSYPFTRNEIYRNQITLHAIALQGLSILEKDLPTLRTATDQVLLSLLKLQDGDGLRGRSTQTNMQVFVGLSMFMQSRGISQSDAISCDLVVNGQPYGLGIQKGSSETQLTVPLDTTTQQVATTWTCNSAVIFDQTLERLPADVTTIQSGYNDVDLLQTHRQLENTTPIGMLDSLESSFAIDNDAEHLAVEIYLPATHRFVATTSSEYVGSDSIPFEVTGGFLCYPNHFEVRYDRLFLYYATMKAGTRCDISIEAIKSLTGRAGVMPMRIFEMYRARVFGNTAPLQTVNR